MTGNRRAILANPASGRLARGGALEKVHRLGRLFDCPIRGLNTTSAEEFKHCVAEASRQFDLLIVAGGDGTMADVVNSLDPARRPEVALAYVPFGTGNALYRALGSPSLKRYLKLIDRAEPRPIHPMLVDGRRLAFMASLGLDALTLKKRADLENLGLGGFVQYGPALAAAAREYRPMDMAVHQPAGQNGGQTHPWPQGLTVIVSAHPYYGYGLLVNQGRLTEPLLNLRAVSGSTIRLAGLTLAAILRRPPRSGLFLSGQKFTVRCAGDQWFQADGECLGRGREYTFELAAEPLRLIF